MHLLDRLLVLYIKPLWLVLEWIDNLHNRIFGGNAPYDDLAGRHTRGLFIMPPILAYVLVPVLFFRHIVSDQFKNPIIFAGVLLFMSAMLYGIARYRHIARMLK